MSAMSGTPKVAKPEKAPYPTRTPGDNISTWPPEFGSRTPAAVSKSCHSPFNSRIASTNHCGFGGAESYRADGHGGAAPARARARTTAVRAPCSRRAGRTATRCRGSDRRAWCPVCRFRPGSEHIGVERPRAEALRERGAAKQVPPARAGLELGLEQLALRIAPVGGAGRRLYAEQERSFGACHLVVEEAVLAEHDDVANSGRVAAVVHRVAGNPSSVRMVAFADVGADRYGRRTETMKSSVMP